MNYKDLAEKIQEYQKWYFYNATLSGNRWSFFYLIDWNTLKAIKLQRNDEISICVNVAKAEKIDCMAYGEIKAQLYCVLSVIKMGNQQGNSE